MTAWLSAQWFISGPVVLAFIVAVCVAATRYAILHGKRIDEIRAAIADDNYWQGYDDGQGVLMAQAAQHAAELEREPEYHLRVPGPHDWLGEQLGKLYTWSAREQDKARRWYWRTMSAPSPELGGLRPLPPAQMTLELEA